MELKELRISKGLTQNECAKFLNIPPRTYWRYENDKNKVNNIKYQYMIDKLNEYNFIDETHGILKIEDIKTICNKIFRDYEVKYAYLFGSYAKGKAKEDSDVDLLISMPVDSLKYFELIERLREELGKVVDLLTMEDLEGNINLTEEILGDGIKIYG